MIVADTGAVLALIDRDDRHHRMLKSLYQADPEEWLLPWAILPEVDYLVAAHLSPRVHEAWLADLAAGAFQLEWGDESDLERAHQVSRKYRSLRLGLVDCVVIVIAERLAADAIATLDVRHFGVVAIKGAPRLLPRDA